METAPCTRIEHKYVDKKSFIGNQIPLLQKRESHTQVLRLFMGSSKCTLICPIIQQ